MTNKPSGEKIKVWGETSESEATHVRAFTPAYLNNEGAVIGMASWKRHYEYDTTGKSIYEGDTDIYIKGHEPKHSKVVEYLKIVNK